MRLPPLLKPSRILQSDLVLSLLCFFRDLCSVTVITIYCNHFFAFLSLLLDYALTWLHGFFFIYLTLSLSHSKDSMLKKRVHSVYEVRKLMLMKLSVLFKVTQPERCRGWTLTYDAGLPVLYSFLDIMLCLLCSFLLKYIKWSWI